MSICDVPVISSVCERVGEGAASLISAPFEWLAHAIGSAAQWMFEGVWSLFDSTTLVDITGDGYIDVYNVVFGIAVLITFAFFLLQLIGSMIRREPGALGRAATGMLKSVFGAFILVTITTLLLEIVDQLCIGIVQASGTTLEEMGGRIGHLLAGLTTLQIAAPGAAAIMVIFLSFLAISAAAIVWFSLLIRKALILVLVVMGPIALAGASWDVTRGWFAKWAGFVLALILSKFVVVLVFLVAITQTSVPIDMDLVSIADPIAGIVLMFIAAFAPYMCYKLLAFAGADMYALASTEQEAKQSMNRPLPVPHPPKPETSKPVLESTGQAAPTSSKPPASSAVPSAPTSAPASGAPAGGVSAGAGTSGGGAGATAGPVGLAAIGAMTLVKGAAQAGPKAGNAVGGAAQSHAEAADQDVTTPPGAQPPAATSSPAGQPKSSPSRAEPSRHPAPSSAPPVAAPAAPEPAPAPAASQPALATPDPEPEPRPTSPATAAPPRRADPVPLKR